MSQCLRCSKPCAPTGVFCDECRSLLRNQLQQGPASPDVQQPQGEPLAVASSFSERPTVEGKSQGQDAEGPVTGPQPIVRDPQTPQPPTLSNYTNIAEQTLSRLNEAARRISQAKQGRGEHKGRQYPHASRLAPIRDISADIQRASTPLPKVSIPGETTPASGNPSSNGRLPIPGERKPDEIENQATISTAGQAAKDVELPDLWPWLDTELEDREVDNWANQTDPLLSRHFPDSSESARIEEEDMRRAAADGISTAPFPTYRRSYRSPRLRTAFIALAILAVLAMIADGILLSFAFSHSPQVSNVPGGPPALTLSSNQASAGSTLQLIISHFTPSTTVYLTHDIDEAVQTTRDTDYVPLDAQGNARTMIIIDDSWGPGFHLLFAEDVQTRYTASAQLQIVGQGQSRPPRLVLPATTINLGTDYQDANTIQNLTLANGGDGSITWTASSNSSWLQVSPSQGMFSKSQTIVIAAQRSGLKPGNYTGKLTFSSNVGSAQVIVVQMYVRQLLAKAGPVLSLSPAVLSFTTMDGNTQTLSQTLTISNPGSQTLNWSLAVNDSTNQSSQDAFLHMLGPDVHWLTTDLSSGVIPAGSSETVEVSVQSAMLLPGTYLGTLNFNARGAIDGPQAVSVSLTVQPHCGLIVSPGGLSFTSVQGQGNPSNQTLNLSLTSSCDGSIVTWHAVSSAGWLSATPAGGQLKGAMSTVTSVGVNNNGLAPGRYNGTLTFVAGQSTLTVAVQLAVQPAPPPAEPIMSASPLNLNFSNIQGQPNPSGQVVTITNNGTGPLYWKTTVNQFSSSWLGAAPTGGVIPAKQTGQVTVNVDTSTLSPGTYVGQVVLEGTDKSGHAASGSPQNVTVNLVVQPPCVLTQPSSSALTFSYTEGGTAPTPQNVTFTGTGSCAWPLNWTAALNPPSSTWLTLTPPGGSIKTGGEAATIQVSVNTTGLLPGTYSAQVTISAADNSGAPAQGSPQTFTVTLTVVLPCTFQSPPSPLLFAAIEGQPATPASQTFTIAETGGCSYPVSWTAVGDPNSTAWLSFTPISGSDGGSGSQVTVTISSTSMAPGTYTGQITVSATDNNGVSVQGSYVVTVQLTITAGISGTIFACAGPPPLCPNPQPLAGATVTLISNGNAIQTVLSDSSGNYAFTQVAPGLYTITISGTQGGMQYSGVSSSIQVSGNISGFNIDVFSG
ncbi:MAG TPA: carboxypeptidase regulatory-like domain-containing protein [Ktedonobacteraceae bacterium]|nr:carboxypeptidase regulatory-like domain-containing protein [Ktedonobacteraceae bacterium]